MVKEIQNIDDFKSAISSGKTGLVVIDFYADWCGPCKMIAPKYAKLAEKYPNIGFYKLNSDKNETAKICEICEISALPTFCFFKGGKYLTKMVGANDSNLENIIIQNLPKNNIEEISA